MNTLRPNLVGVDGNAPHTLTSDLSGTVLQTADRGNSQICYTHSPLCFLTASGAERRMCIVKHTSRFIFALLTIILSADICFTIRIFTNCVIATVFSSSGPPSLIARCFKCPAGSRSLSHVVQNKNPRVFSPGVLWSLSVFVYS